MTRVTPNIGDPKPVVTNPLNITLKQATAYLKKKKLPITKINIRKATATLRKAAIDKLPRGKDITVNQADAPMQIIYGQMRVGGVLSFLHTSANKESLFYIVTIAGHQISSLDKVYLDNKEVIFGASPDPRWSTYLGTTPANNKIFVQANLGSPGQSAISDAVSSLPGYWTANHKQSNRAHFFMILKYTAELFSEGAPEVSCLVSGRPIFDPRTNTEYFTDNAALCIANYLMDTVYGLGVSYSDIDVASLSAAADVCDELVPLKAGGNEKRYTINGRFDADLSHKDVLTQMCSAYGGNVIFTNGKWRFLPATYRTPNITLTDNELRSAPKVSFMTSKSDLINGIRGTYVSKENNWEVTDFPPTQNSTYITEDGEVINGELDLPFTTSSTMAQRIGKIELEKNRRQIQIDASWALKAYELDICDNAFITLSRFGFSNKVFEVLDYAFEISNGNELLVNLKLKENDSGCYSWNNTIDENAITAAPSTDLPNPNLVSPPTSLVLESGTNELDIRLDGTVFSRIKVSWTLPDDYFVQQSGKIKIQYKKTTDSIWQNAGEVDGNISFFRILDVLDGVNYDVRVYSVNGVGIASTYLTGTHTVIGKTVPPLGVSNFVSTFQDYVIKLIWDSIPDLDLKEYEIKRGGTDWASSTYLTRIKGNSFSDPYQTAGTIKYFIKAIDTSGNYSTTATMASITITAPGTVQNLTCESVDNNVLLDWDAPSASSFPIARYKIYKGATFGGATYIGNADGTFTSFFEKIGGTYTYWVVPVDTGGNIGTEISIARTIYNPPDFVLQNDQILTIAGGTFSNCMVDDSLTNGLLALVNTTETWTQHFTNNSWTTIQDQINAGKLYYIEPSGTSGYYEKTVDYGASLPPGLCRLSHQTTVIDGSIAITYTISSKLNIGDAWVDYSGNSVFLPSAFRYVKYRLDFTATGNNDIAKYFNLNAVLEVKKQKDSGNGLSIATTGWVTVLFNKDFIDVKSIQVTPATTSNSEELMEIVKYDWSAPDVDQFQVRIIDRATGTQLARRFSWEAEGVVRPP